MLVTEIGRGQCRDPVFSCLGQPKLRSPYKQLRRHQKLLAIRGQRCQVKSNQTHIMRQWHPAQVSIIRLNSHALDNGIDIRSQISMCQHNTFRCASRTRRKLNECRFIRCGFMNEHIGLTGRIVAHEATGQLFPFVVKVQLRGKFLYTYGVVFVHAQPRCFKLIGNTEQFVSMFSRIARRYRYRDDAPEKTSPERNEKLFVVCALNDQVITGSDPSRMKLSKTCFRELEKLVVWHPLFTIRCGNECDAKLTRGACLK